MEDWINIKDNPPPPLTEIKILHKHSGMSGTAAYCAGFWMFRDDYDSWESPTHWMPLNNNLKEMSHEREHSIKH